MLQQNNEGSLVLLFSGNALFEYLLLFFSTHKRGREKKKRKTLYKISLPVSINESGETPYYFFLQSLQKPVKSIKYILCYDLIYDVIIYNTTVPTHNLDCITMDGVKRECVVSCLVWVGGFFGGAHGVGRQILMTSKMTKQRDRLWLVHFSDNSVTL